MTTPKKTTSSTRYHLFESIKRRTRSSEFAVLLEQEDDEEGGEAADVAYTPPRDRLLAAPDVSDSVTEKDASVDEKIDSYIIRYERDAVGLGSDKEKEEELQIGTAQPIAEHARSIPVSLYSALFEQATPPSPPGGADASLGAPGDTGGMPDMGMGGMPDLGGGMDAGAGGEPKPADVAPVPKINIRRFAEGIARLAMNYQSLIDPQTIILNRAMFYVAKNYSPRLARELMSILERDFDLSPKTPSQKRAEIPAAPRAGGSGPEDGGGVPSGGGGGVGGD